MSNNHYPNSQDKKHNAKREAGVEENLPFGDSERDASESKSNTDSGGEPLREEVIDKNETYDISDTNDFDAIQPDAPSEMLSEAERILDERNSYLDSLQRLQADFENFRKRAQRQQTESKELATCLLIEKLLPVLDAFELALAHMDRNSFVEEQLKDVSETKEAKTKIDKSATGATMAAELKPFIQIGSLLENILQKEGLTKIGHPGEQFNPTYHDAVSHEPAEDPEETGIIVEVMRSGYKLKERVLRPAMVKVKG